MKTSINHQLALISVETDVASMEGLFSGFLEGVKDRLLKIKGTFKPSVVSTQSLSSELKDKVNKANYLKVKNAPTTIPLNFKGHMLPYLTVLQDALKLCARIESESLIPAKRHFAYLLGNPDQLKAISPAITRQEIVDHNIEIQTLKQRIVDFHDHGATTTIVAYGDVYPNMTGFVSAVALADDLNHIITHDKRLEVTHFTKLIDEISGILDRLLIRIQQNPESYSRNIDVTRDLAKLVFDIAEEAEFVSSVISIIYGVYNGSILPSITMLSNAMQDNIS